MKITFIAEHPDGEKVTLSGEAELLSETLMMFERFLKGAGFYTYGNLEFIDEDTEALFPPDSFEITKTNFDLGEIMEKNNDK